jgi:hypothetical protein
VEHDVVEGLADRGHDLHAELLQGITVRRWRNQLASRRHGAKDQVTMLKSTDHLHPNQRRLGHHATTRVSVPKFFCFVVIYHRDAISTGCQAVD